MHDPREESEHYIECSGRIVLECKCGEYLTLLGLEEDWQGRSEHADFRCGYCGESLDLAERRNEQALAVKRLLRGGGAPTRRHRPQTNPRGLA